MKPLKSMIIHSNHDMDSLSTSIEEQQEFNNRVKMEGWKEKVIVQPSRNINIYLRERNGKKW